MTNLTEDESKILSAIAGGEWVRIEDLRDVTGIWRIYTVVQAMADQGLVEIQIRRSGNMVRVPRYRRGGVGGG
jgi:hypothetical protein